MPEFRKWIIASAAVTLFAGLASAQVGGGPGGAGSVGQAFTCGVTNGAVTPTLRSEGFTELTGDIVLICSGGSPLPTGTGTPAIPTANITVFLNTTVTSRLLSATSVGGTTASEALLLVDEPNSQLTGYGPGVPLTLCSNSTVGAGPGGCTEYVGASNISGGTLGGVPVSSAPTATNCAPGFTCAPGANVFQGVTSGNQVVFNGIPVMPPATAGDTRVYRITNIRANANGIVGGGPTPGSVTASLSINSSTSLAITNSTLTVGFVQQGLSPTNTFFGKTTGGSNSGASLAQCSTLAITSSGSAQGLIQFSENFATAFKVRGTNAQNIPGAIFSSESGFTLVGLSNTTSGTAAIATAGLADYGTRLKATFNNVPSGVSLYVTTRDVVNDFSSANATGYGTSQAVLVLGETAIDSGYLNSLSQSNSSSGVPTASQTTTASTTNGGVALSPVAINPSTNTGFSVWEVINTNPNQVDTIDFGLYVAYTANAAANSPAAPSTFSVTLSYAPTPSGGAFTSTTGAAASASLTIPRFSDSLDITKNVASITLCTTPMLFPYVINVNGFDTGLAIANTTTDPFGTTAQQGTCSLYFYGLSAPTTNPFVTPIIATGTDYANLASTLAPGFSGYMIANCNFQYAHGFAFVSDVGARNLAMGYLALIFTSGSSLNRISSAVENLNN